MIQMHKLMAVCENKLKAMRNMNVLIAPLMSLGITVIMRMVYSQLLGKAMTPVILGSILNMGLLFSITMIGMIATSISLAEEKEKHTLRTLMTSSVSGLEFFLGSMIPPMLVMTVVNALLLPISGISMASVNLPSYFLITTIAGITSCIIGMIVGIFAKNQASANSLSTPGLLIFTLIPLFGSMLDSLNNISKFLFTGVVSQMVDGFVQNKGASINVMGVLVLSAEIVLAAVLFLWIYKKNGFEAE